MERKLPEANPAQLKLADIAARAATTPATITNAHSILSTLLPVGHTLFRHQSTP
jgi:hypothetical protein